LEWDYPRKTGGWQDWPVVHWALDALRGTAPKPPQDGPGLRGGPTGRVPSRRGKRRRRALIALALAFAVAGAVTARVFVWPAQGMPAHVSAILLLDAPDDSVSVALRLARQDRAPFLLVSLGTPKSWPGTPGCPRPVPRVKIICFNPQPATTQGEAEFAARLAKKYHWRSIAVVAIAPQASRARLRMERCFAGRVYVVATAIPLTSWPFEIAYQWASLIKALALQRSC
jgi:hypothetical protein